MNDLGIDIGTTTISAVLINENGDALHIITRPNTSAIKSSFPFESLQDPEKIWQIIKDILVEMENTGFSFDRIGITGQMHGILYTDHQGIACSPLYTWQDNRGNQFFEKSLTYSQKIRQEIGLEIPSGYGVCTHYYNIQKGAVPPMASKLCTIGDYIVMRLTDRTAPLLHPSMAASLGGFDLRTNTWEVNVLEALFSSCLLPQVSPLLCSAGKDRKNREVMIAIGDNQASFLGSAEDPEHTVLVNIGTGSQVSFLTALEDRAENCEIRPFINGTFLSVGSALCGGKAFALLERFFCRTAEFVTGKPVASAYDAIDRYLEHCEELTSSLTLHSQFCGTRCDPSVRGSLENISLENFTPEELILSFMQGILSELYEFYKPWAKKSELKNYQVVGSGNGLRLNPAMQKMCAAVFGLPFSLSPYQEEAARGAALSCKYA